jgi:hypothetical protein
MNRPGGLRITINELRNYKIAIAAIQETRWNKFTPQAFTSNGYNIYTSSLANNHEFGAAFLVDSKFTEFVVGDANAKVRRETVHQPTIGKHSLHESTNENGLRLVDFATGR